MTEQFFLTLPSTSSLKLYPENTPSNYITHLVKPLHLVGEWEVALTEFHFPQTLFNVTQGSNKIKASGSDIRGILYSKVQKEPAKSTEITVKTAYVTPGYYRNDQDFLLAVNKQLTLNLDVGSIRLNNSTKDAYFQPRTVTSTVTDTTSTTTASELKPASETDKKEKYHLSFSPVLARQLGFEPHINLFNESHAKMPISLSWGLPRHIFIYSDIVSPQIVGDTVAPLLRMVNTGQEKFKYGDEASIILHSPQYLPVAKRQFDTIEIDLRENSGRPVPFMFGTSAVVLHFRRKFET